MSNLTEYKISKENIISAIVPAMEKQGHVLALWEMGAASFSRVDEWSDIDIIVVVADNKIEETFSAMENALAALTEIDLEMRMPEPTPFGYSQKFYRLKDASPFLMVDFSVIKDSNDYKFLQHKIHNPPLVHFDKKGIAIDAGLDEEKHKEEIKARIEWLRLSVDMFSTLPLKEINRGNYIEAYAFYFGYTLRPLIEVLRIKHCPERFDFSTRYIHYDIPQEDVQRLQNLFFIGEPEALQSKHEEALKWFWEIMDGL